MENRNNEKHYATLGIHNGASQEEIDAAFQRVKEQCPPELRDASVEVRTRFHEMRNAYYMLCNTDALDALDDELARLEEESSYFQKISLRDYFSRLRLVIAVVGSIIAVSAVTIITPILFTDESYARFLTHTVIFVFGYWLVYWYVRFIYLRLMPFGWELPVVLFVLSSGVAYSLWIYFVTLPEKMPFLSQLYSIYSPQIQSLFAFFMCFAPIVGYATFFSERKGKSKKRS